MGKLKVRSAKLTIPNRNWESAAPASVHLCPVGVAVRLLQQ
jgi:hypothetical protein